MAKKWYVIQTYSGYEAKVKEALLQRIKEHHVEARFGEVLIPTETVTEQRAGGKARTRQKTSFPGYIFVEMEMTEDVDKTTSPEAGRRLHKSPGRKVGRRVRIVKSYLGLYGLSFVPAWHGRFRALRSS